MTAMLQLADDEPVVVPPIDGATVRRFERIADYRFAAPGGRRLLTLVDASDLDTLGDPTRSVAAESRTLFRQVYPPAGWLTAAGVRTDEPMPTGDAVLNVVMDVDDAVLDEFHAWYAEEHLPALVAVPGILAARRFTAVDGDVATAGRSRFVAIYELVNEGVVRTDEFAAASQMTPRIERLLGHLDWASQLYARC